MQFIITITDHSGNVTYRETKTAQELAGFEFLTIAAYNRSVTIEQV